MIPPAALLMGWGAAQVAPRLQRRPALTAAAAVGVLAALALLHQWVVFVRHTPEYKRVYPAARLPGYWTPFGGELPRGGYFGFPYRAGWRAIQAWYASGVLSGSYDSNEEVLITGWYTGGAARCADRPRYLIEAWRPQDEEEFPEDPVALGYHLRRVVTVGGQEKLWVYMLDEPGAVSYAAAEDVAPPGRSKRLVMKALELPLAMVDLAGADAEPATGETGTPDPAAAADAPTVEAAEFEPNAVPGGAFTTALVLRAGGAEQDAQAPVGALSTNYSTYVHVRDAAGTTVAGSDHWPACGDATSGWQPGEMHYDAHSVPIGQDVAPGTYEVWAGVHRPDGARVAERRVGTLAIAFAAETPPR
jgi:hypothetical protein